MGREHLDNYFYHCRNMDLSPLKIEAVQNPQSGLFRLSVRDKLGVRVVDFEELDSDGFRREAGSLGRSLIAKGYNVTIVFNVAQHP